MATIDKPAKIKGFDKYEVEGAANTLARAEEIKNKPKLLAAAKTILAQKAQAAIEACAALKVKTKSEKAAKKLFGWK